MISSKPFRALFFAGSTFLAFGAAISYAWTGPTQKASGDKGQPATKTLKPDFSLDVGKDYDVSEIRVSSDGKFAAVLVSGKPHSIQIWDIEKKSLTRAIEVPGYSRRIAISPDNKTIAYATIYPHIVVLVDVQSGKTLRKLEKTNGKFENNVDGLYFSPSGDLLVMTDEVEIIGWNPQSGEQKFAWKETQKITAVSNFFDEGKKLASGYKDKKNQIKIWDIATGQSVQSLFDKSVSDLQVHGIAFSSDSKLMASRHTFGAIRIWDLAKGKAVSQVEGITPSLFTNLLFVPATRLVAFGGGAFNKDHITVYLADAETGKIHAALEGHTKSITSIAITPDGAKLISGADDKSIKVWNLKDIK